MAVDSSGNVVVTGYASIGAYDTDYYTAKYAASNGALLWEQRYNGPANGPDYVGGSHCLAIGKNGMVAVTGGSDGDYATVVYWETLPPVSIEKVPAGVRIRFAGVPGQSYEVQRASGVSGLWSTLATPTAPLNGLIEYLDSPLPPGTSFYRIATAP